MKPNIEENEDDIFIAVKYEDHGDEFLYVETIDDKRYEYGWYLNRPSFPEYEDLLDKTAIRNPFIRNPKINLDPSWVKEQKEIQEDMLYFEDDYIDFEDWNSIISNIYLIKNRDKYGETIAGKKKVFDDKLYGDEVQKIWVNPKYSTKKQVYVGRDGNYDDFGCDGFVLNLNLIRK